MTEYALDHTRGDEDTLDGADVVDQAPEPDATATDFYSRKPKPPIRKTPRPRVKKPAKKP